MGHGGMDGATQWMLRGTSVRRHRELSKGEFVKAVVQRVSEGLVTVAGATVGEIATGLVVLVGVARNDALKDADVIADKLAGLRVFADDSGQMNRSVQEVSGAVLVISQFTLYGDSGRGRRPSFAAAAPSEAAEPLVEAVAARIERLGIPVARGRFGSRMSVALVNEGPVTVILETRDGRLV